MSLPILCCNVVLLSEFVGEERSLSVDPRLAPVHEVQSEPLGHRRHHGRPGNVASLSSSWWDISMLLWGIVRVALSSSWWDISMLLWGIVRVALSSSWWDISMLLWGIVRVALSSSWWDISMLLLWGILGHTPVEWEQPGGV